MLKEKQRKLLPLIFVSYVEVVSSSGSKKWENSGAHEYIIQFCHRHRIMELSFSRNFRLIHLKKFQQIKLNVINWISHYMSIYFSYLKNCWRFLIKSHIRFKWSRRVLSPEKLHTCFPKNKFFTTLNSRIVWIIKQLIRRRICFWFYESLLPPILSISTHRNQSMLKS